MKLTGKKYRIIREPEESLIERIELLESRWEPIWESFNYLITGIHGSSPTDLKIECSIVLKKK